MSIQNPKFKLFAAISTLIGTTIGAGIFGLPYAAAQAGWAAFLLWLVLLTPMVIISTLMLGEIVVHTKTVQQIPGYAEKYLGRWGKTAGAVSLLFFDLGAALAYMVGIGTFLSMLWSDFPAFWGGILALVLTLVIVSLGVKSVARAEALIVVLIFVLVIVLIGSVVPAFDLWQVVEWDGAHFFLPYGVLFYALDGRSAVPVMREIMGLSEARRKLRSAIIAGITTPAFIYGAFALAVYFAVGENTSVQALEGLVDVIGPVVPKIGAVMGILAMGSSFIAYNLYIREVFEYDYKWPAWTSLVAVVVVLMTLYLLDFRNFTMILSIAGAVGAGLVSIIIVLSYEKLMRSLEVRPVIINIPRWGRWALILFLLAGVLWELGQYV